MPDPLVCWKCGRSIDDLPQPLGRYDICPGCRTELYVCRMCEFFDPQIGKGCQEPIAEEVLEKERANFCNFFQVRANAFQPAAHNDDGAARAALDALFGGGHKPPSTSTAGESTPPTAADEGSARLEQLFGDKEPE